ERLAAEEEDRGVRREARRERVHDLRIPDELERDEPEGPDDVVLENVAVVALDRGENEVLDRAHGLESRGDGLRLGEVEGKRRDAPARDPGGHPGAAGGGATRADNRS